MNVTIMLSGYLIEGFGWGIGITNHSLNSTSMETGVWAVRQFAKTIPMNLICRTGSTVVSSPGNDRHVDVRTWK